ncbi:hypothetical protein Tco_0015571 [Tanacetum coccineum]
MNYMPQPMQNLEDSSNPTTAMNKALALIAKSFKVNTIPTNNNQRSSSIPHNNQIAQPDMNTIQDIKMQMVDDNDGNQVRQNTQHDGNEVGQNAVQNSGIQNVENMNGLSVVLEISNQYENGNVVIAPAEGNGNGINDAYEETKRVKVNCTLEDTLQQASTYGTQSENAPVYDSDGSTEKRHHKRYENEYLVYKAINLGKTTFFSDKTNALSKLVTSNSAPSTRESKVVQTVNVISHRIFRINPSKTSRVDNVVPNKPVKTSIRIKPITVSQPNVIHKQQANSDSNGYSSTRVNNTAKTRRPHSRRNSNTDRVPSKSKSNFLSNNVEKIKENHRNSQIPKNQKHMSSECNNITLAIRNDKSEIVCVMCKQCLVTANHDVCVLNYVNDMNSRTDNQSANVSICENQKKHKANAKKSKESGNIENQSEKSVCDNASTSNSSKPSSKGFSNSASLLGSDALHNLPNHSESLKRYLFHFSWRSTHCYGLSHSKVADIEKAAVRSSLRLPNNKCALIKSIAIEINLYLIRGHIHNRTLVEHHPVHELLSRVLRIILVIIARTLE